jgi:hypothetical protein
MPKHKRTRNIMRATQWDSPFMQEARDRILKPAIMDFLRENPEATFRDMLTALHARFRSRFVPAYLRKYLSELGVKRVAAYRIVSELANPAVAGPRGTPAGQAEFEDADFPPDFHPDPEGPDPAPDAPESPVSEGDTSEGDTPPRQASLSLHQIQQILSTPIESRPDDRKPLIIRGQI